MDINIKLIDQRLSQLRALIPRFKADPPAAENRCANKKITCELKRIEALNALETKFGDLKQLIPIYTAHCPANESVLAD